MTPNPVAVAGLWWTFPPPHQRESLALRFSAIRYDLETPGQESRTDETLDE